EFEPRRRQDVDMIFLIATPAEARQIKPTLAFHYAGDVPVYATSQIYTGQISTTDSDLNGIRFNTLPWQFDHTRPEKQLLSQHSQVPIAFIPLQAMGVDAYHLYPRLPQLHRLGRARLFGATGNLSLNAQGQVKRELIWARFTGNNVELLPAIIDQPND
ncbi:MAG TPA: penicillin-binding protein activator, partial [Cellvibrionaceae bacterium]